MKRPLTILFSSFLMALILCTLIYRLYIAGIEQFEIHKRERLSEIFENSTNYSVLFLGSSRTHTTINPAITDSILRVPCYNAGVEGGFIKDFLMTYKGYLIHHPPPKILLLSLDLWSFESHSGIFDYIQYFPLINNPEVDSYRQSHGYHTSIYSAFPMFTLIHLDDYTRTNAIKGYMGKTEIPLGEFQFAGYMSNTNKTISDNDNQNHLDSLQSLALTNRSSLSEFINLCKESGTRLVISYAPEYQQKLQLKYSNSDVFFKLVSSDCINNNIPFYRDDKLELSSNPTFFANPGHVNTKGAQVYSVVLSHQLMNTFPQLFAIHSTKN